MKALPWLTHQLGDGDTFPKLPSRRPALAGMLSRNPKEIMPVIPLTQLHHHQAAKGAIADHRTIGRSNMRRDALEKFGDALPEPLFPFRLTGHDFPGQR